MAARHRSEGIHQLVWCLACFAGFALLVACGEERAVMELPTLSTLRPMPARSSCVPVDVDADGSVHIDGKATAPGDVKAVLVKCANALREAGVAKPALLARCDRRASWSDVDQVLRIAGAFEVRLYQAFFVVLSGDGAEQVFPWRVPNNVDSPDALTTEFSVWINSLRDAPLVRTRLEEGPKGWRNGVVGLALEPRATVADVLSVGAACRQSGAQFLLAVVSQRPEKPGVVFADHVHELPARSGAAQGEVGFASAFYFSEQEWEDVGKRLDAEQPGTDDDQTDSADFEVEGLSD